MEGEEDVRVDVYCVGHTLYPHIVSTHRIHTVHITRVDRVRCFISRRATSIPTSHTASRVFVP